MIIRKPWIEEREGQTYLLSMITDEIVNKTTEVFFCVDNKYKEYLVDENSDAFVIAMLWPAIVSGQDIIVEGTISDYCYKLSEPMLYLLSKTNNAKQIKVIADNVASFEFEPHAVAAAFSGGIDSFANYILHTSDNCPERFKLTHLTLFNLGSYGTTFEITNDEFIDDAKRAQKFADKVGMPLVIINSNISNICADHRRNAFSFFMINNIAACVTALQKLFKIYYISGSDVIDNTNFNIRHQGFHENSIVQLLSNNNTSIFVTEQYMDRPQKTKLIADSPITYDELCVCVAPIANELYDLGFQRNGYMNCGECFKCIRTLLTLDAYGDISKYSRCFDLDKYHRMRDKMIADLREDSKDPLRFDVLNLLVEKGVIS